MAIILRTVKGTSLTYEEMDRNLSQFTYSGSIGRAENQHTLYLHYTGSSGLGYVPRSESIDITPFPFTGTAQITGSFQVTGSIYYNGELLENLIGSGGGVSATSSVFVSPFLNTLSHIVVHPFGTEDVIVTVYNDQNYQIIPSSVYIVDENVIEVTFTEITSGKVLVLAAGISGSVATQDLNLVADPGIYLQQTGLFTLVGLDTGSTYFQDAVYAYGIFRETGSFWNTTNNVGITGSLQISLESTTDYVGIAVSGSNQITVNSEGILSFTSQSTEPTPVPGGIYFGADNNYYLGFY